MHTLSPTPFRFNHAFAGLAFLVFACAWSLRAEDNLPDLSIRTIGEATRVWRFLPDGNRQEQFAALWIHRDTTAPRGLMLLVNDGDDPFPETLRHFARDNHFGLLSLRLQEDNLSRVLADSLGKMAAALEQPALANVPWILLGQGKNAAKALDFTRALPEADTRILCLILRDFPGGLRISPHSNISPDQAVLQHIPVLNLLNNRAVNPSGREWANTHYMAIQSQFLPYAMALGEMADPTSETRDALIRTFIEDVHRHRVPEGHDFQSGPADLKPFRYEDGLLAGPYLWRYPPVGKTRPATRDEVGAVWLPSETFARRWFAFHDPDRAPSASEPEAASAPKDNIDALERLYAGLAPTEENLLERLDDGGTDLDAATWTLRLSEDFEGRDKGDWSLFSSQNPGLRRRNAVLEASSLIVTNGVLQLSGSQQAFAMLRYDWPDNVAVEYKARSVSPQPNDLSLILHGTSSGAAMPWMHGLVYQFGGYRNNRSFFMIPGSRPGDRNERDDGARIRPGDWHHVRIEKRGDSLRVWVDGAEREKSAQTLSPQEIEGLKGRKIGFYTYAGEAEFDDVNVYTLEAEKPPAEGPPEDGLLTFARALLLRAQSPALRQRQASQRMLQRHMVVLAPALRALLEDTGFAVPDALRARLLEDLRNLPPTP